MGYFERTHRIGQLARDLGCPCPTCRGSGNAPPSFDGCFSCGGSGRVLPKKITLCGSTRFKDAWTYWARKLTLTEPALVFTVSCFGHVDPDPPTDNEKALLDQIHKAKISVSDEIFILDVDGYIGDSTRSEIEFATEIGTPVRYLSQEAPDWSDKCTGEDDYV